MSSAAPPVVDRPAGASGATPARPPASRWRRLRTGSPADPAWARPALLVLLAGTALLYLWGLGSAGYGNSFYAAAVQAGTKSWKALLFGSLDSQNSITVDKPPASLWVMGLSGRIFGFGSWSLLAPQALMGVASVALVHAAVKRWHGALAGLVAGLVLALTPVAVLMFRFDNPDALLVLLMTAAAYCTVRAVEAASTRWLALAGVALGFGFLTKMGQALLVLPALGLVYLVAAPTPLRRRIVQLLVAALALVVSAGWYVLLVQLWPASDRPYIGGSTDNTLLELALGYNGLGRLLGGSGNGGGGGGGGGGGFGGTAGLTRLFNSEFGTEISWLLPAALVALVVVLVVSARAPRTDRLRASALLWGGWLLVTGLVFSFMSGTIHSYYSVALAPAIAALIALGARELWRLRESAAWRAVAAGTLAITGVWAFVLLQRASSWHPEVRFAVAVLTVLAVALAALPPRIADRASSGARLVVVAAVVALLAGLVGPGAFAVETAGTVQSGSTPSAGPAVTGGTSGFGGARGLRGTPGGSAAGQGGTGGGLGGQGGPPSGSMPGSSTGSGSTGPGAAPGPGTAPTTGGSGMGDVQTSSALTSLLRSSTARWAAAIVSSNSAAPLELASGTAVLAIGGWSGSDPSPTLAQFEEYVAKGEIGYYVVSGMGGGAGGTSGTGSGSTTSSDTSTGTASSSGATGEAPGGTTGGLGGGMGGSGTSSQIAAWVEANFTAKTVGGTTVYDLSSPTTSSSSSSSTGS